jgi:hypothetical protein
MTLPKPGAFDICLASVNQRQSIHFRWVDYQRGLPMFASHAHFMEAAIRWRDLVRTLDPQII